MEINAEADLGNWNDPKCANKNSPSCTLVLFPAFFFFFFLLQKQKLKEVDLDFRKQLF